jgi:hypothetical protein
MTPTVNAAVIIRPSILCQRQVEKMNLEADSLIDALHDTGPFEPLADKLQLFGQFVGAWDLEWHGQDGEGRDVVVAGELHFGWILGGRAVQDVWKVPKNPADAPAGLGGFHGTTIRFYDPKIDAWRSTWINPRAGRVSLFIGKPAPDGIYLTCTDTDRKPERWSFHDITPTSFRWVGEYSEDGGKTWIQDEEMLATRRA